MKLPFKPINNLTIIIDVVILICCNSVSKHTYVDIYTLNAKYHNYIYFKKALKVCDKYNNIIIEVFNIHIIAKLHKSKGIPNILKYP